MSTAYLLVLSAAVVALAIPSIADHKPSNPHSNLPVPEQWEQYSEGFGEGVDQELKNKKKHSHAPAPAPEWKNKHKKKHSHSPAPAPEHKWEEYSEAFSEGINQELKNKHKHKHKKKHSHAPAPAPAPKHKKKYSYPPSQAPILA